MEKFEALEPVLDEKEMKNMIPTIFEETFLKGEAKGEIKGETRALFKVLLCCQ